MVAAVKPSRLRYTSPLASSAAAMPRLPITPLVEVLEARRRVEVPELVAGACSAQSMCRRAGVHTRSFYQWRRVGHLPAAVADRLAIALGLHPVLLWPEEWPDVLRRRWS